MRKILLFSLFLFMGLLGGFSVSAQSSAGFLDQWKGRPAIKEGDKAYQKRDYYAAQESYKKADEHLSDMLFLKFRSGNVAYRNEQLNESKSFYQSLLKNEDLKASDQFSAHYNLGNVSLKEEDWDTAIEMYKNALKLKPNDRDAKYNLSYALMKKQSSEDDNDEVNEEEEDKDEDDQDNDQDNDQNNDQDDDQGQDQDNQSQKEQEKPQNNSKLTPEQAERLLQALREEEKNILDNQEEKKGSGQRVLDKDW